MNLVLLAPGETVDERQAEHIRRVLKAKAGDSITVGAINGKIGRAEVLSVDPVRLKVTLDRDPPPPLDVTLVLALPRPKVFNRVIASATSLGIKRMYIVNAWRVEKSYWKSPKLQRENIDAQVVAGLEQAVDTMLPAIHLRRLFRPFVEEELPSLIAGTRAVVAHPGGGDGALAAPLTIAIGPEGGWILPEIESFQRIGFEVVSFGPRILRVETALAALLGRFV
jgi:16S rRNA (uracil1498-N3)-methyltransferase